MKTITINFTHDEVFEDFVKQIVESESETKYINIVRDEYNNTIVNITGTLAELESE